MRTGLDLLLTYAYVLGGGSSRNLELADLCCVRFPEDEGPTPCLCMIVSMTNGKTIKDGLDNYLGACRKQRR